MASILFVSHMSHRGGPTHSMIKLLQYIRDEHEVAVLAPGNGELFDLLAKMDVPYYRVPNLRARMIPAMVSLIRREGFDLVYANNFSSGTRNAIVAAKLARVRSIWHIREMLYGSRRRYTYFLRWPERIIAVSEASAQLVRRYVPRQSIDVIPNGIEPADFDVDREFAQRTLRELVSAGNEDILVISVGRVCPLKGQLFTAELAHRLKTTRSQTIFCLVGVTEDDLEYVQQLEMRLRALQVEDRVHLLNFCTDVPLLLRGADIFLHTSLRDSNPRAVIEAMAAGLPVVAFDVDGVSELVVQDETGYKVAVRDLEALAQHLAALRDDADLRTRLGQAGRALVQTTYRAEQTAVKINAIIANSGP